MKQTRSVRLVTMIIEIVKGQICELLKQWSHNILNTINCCFKNGKQFTDFPPKFKQQCPSPLVSKLEVLVCIFFKKDYISGNNFIPAAKRLDGNKLFKIKADL